MDSDAFLRLLNECVLPHLRTHLLNRWEPRDPEPALAFFEVRVSSRANSPAAYRPSTKGYAYAAKVWAVSLVQRPFHVLSRVAKPSSSDSSPLTFIAHHDEAAGVYLSLPNPSRPPTRSTPGQMVGCTQAWEGLLPGHVRGTLLQQLVVPKLQTAVDAWDPRQETIAIHTWLHPWLPLLGASLEGLYPTIRHRLAACLQQWHPSDGSALALLAPWKPVFSQADWDTLLARSIVPKLQWAMQELVINPQHQVLDQFQWLMAWKSAMPPQHLTTMLESFFFPKLQQVLYQWLVSNPNYEEVTQWYLGWKVGETHDCTVRSLPRRTQQTRSC